MSDHPVEEGNYVVVGREGVPMEVIDVMECSVDEDKYDYWVEDSEGLQHNICQDGTLGEADVE